MIYIVTHLVFNRKAFTKNYLEALVQQTVKNFKVIIVEDGSMDGQWRCIEKEFIEEILLKEKSDLCWAEVTNIGIEYEKCS